MADSTIANALAEASVTGGNGDDPEDVPRRNLQHLLCQAEKDRQTIEMYQDECDKFEDVCIAMENICQAARMRHKRKVDKLEAARRRHHSDKVKIQEFQDSLDVKRAEKFWKMKSQAEPLRPSPSAKAQGDKNFHVEVRDGKRQVKLLKLLKMKSEAEYFQRYYQRNREYILAKQGKYNRTAAGRAASRRKGANTKMKRIMELHECGNAGTLDEIGEKFINRCKSSACREALARLLAARDGSVGTSASASRSSEASSGSGGGVPSPAAAARRKGSTLRWLGDVSADAEGEPPSKKIKMAGPSEDDDQK